MPDVAAGLGTLSGSQRSVDHAPASTRQQVRTYRPELQGLRALAVILVVCYHVWFGRVSGGVDVFFVISGFLLTGQLVRASTRGAISYRPLWGRMIKRLFPAALTVLLVIMAAAVLLLPERRWFQTIREVVAAALYLENWQLAADSVDYLGQRNAASVVQHFWSLSIQGQFFIVWPLLIGLLALVAKRTGAALRSCVTVALVVLFAASLAYSVWLTAADQPLAYFHSLTRVWEFMLGGLLALFVDAIVLPRALRVALGWIGVLGLVSCGMLLQVGSVFPGYVALWPTLCAVLVLLAGATGSRAGADRWLASRSLEYIGNVSYSLYLWHWPVLLMYLAYRGQAEVGLKGGLLVIAVSVVLTVVTYHFVEEPARRSRIGETTRWGAYRFGLVVLVPVLAVAGVWQVVSTQRAEFTVTANDADHPGARARQPGFVYRGKAEVELLPPEIALPVDWASTEGMDCAKDSVARSFEWWCTETPASPTRHVVVIGDSHMQQHLAAMRPIAHRHNWQLTAILKGACPFSSAAEVSGQGQRCVDWNARALDWILQTRPDAVYTLATRNVRVGLTEVTPPGFVEQWRRLAEAGIAVVAVRDNPKHPISPSGCVLRHGVDSPRCATPRAELYAPEPPYRAIQDMPRTVSFIDLTDYYCDQETCGPVVGNVLVYRDFGHPTATFMTTLSPILERKLLAGLGW